MPPTLADVLQVSALIIPPDAVTGAASALDPHIAPRYARLQTARGARVNGLPDKRGEQLVRDRTRPRTALSGRARVTVLKLDLAVRDLLCEPRHAARMDAVNGCR